MLDHVSFSVPPSKFAEILDFYTAILAPLGYTKQMEFPGMAAGFGASKQSAPFWIGSSEKATTGGVNHFAFQAKDHEAVEKFHEEALKAGGTCNGKPGKRDYHPNYYAAFIIDPVGNNIEAVDHKAY